MIARCRGKSRWNSSTDQVSSASARSVWFVYPTVACVTSQAFSHAMECSSTRMRISSGMAMAGCVSLSWMAALSERLSSVLCATSSDSTCKRPDWKNVLAATTSIARLIRPAIDMAITTSIRV